MKEREAPRALSRDVLGFRAGAPRPRTCRALRTYLTDNMAKTAQRCNASAATSASTFIYYAELASPSPHGDANFAAFARACNARERGVTVTPVALANPSQGGDAKPPVRIDG